MLPPFWKASNNKVCNTLAQATTTKKQASQIDEETITFTEYKQPQLVNHEDLALMPMALTVSIDNLIPVSGARVECLIKVLVERSSRVDERFSR